MDRLIFNPLVAIGAAVYVCYLGMSVLPGHLAGMPTAVLLLAGTAGAISAAIRWL